MFAAGCRRPRPITAVAIRSLTRLSRSCRLHDAQHGMSLDVLQRQIDEVARRIYQHDVSVGADLWIAFLQQPRVRLAKDRERSGLARDVQTSATGVKREHVRPFSYREPRRDLAPGEVQHQKLARLLTRDEREMPRQVEVETVVEIGRAHV